MSHGLSPGVILQQLPDIVWREIAGETVLLDPEGSVLMGLNRSGGRMWELLDGKRSIAEVASTLATHYKQPEDAVLGDMMSFAKTLLDKNLARLVEV